jgi:hypothetical protein
MESEKCGKADHRFDIKIISVEPAPKSSEGSQMPKAQ